MPARLGMFQQAPQEEESSMGAVLASNREKLGSNTSGIQAVAGTFRTPVERADGSQITPESYASMVSTPDTSADHTPKAPGRQ